MLTAAALTASAAATHDRLGGPGRWLLALPPYHIAGVQVLVRSLLAGTVPVEMDVSTGFDITELPSAVEELGSGRRYTALVATQLAKALTDPAATAALAELDAVLIGGGPAPRPVLDAAASAGITVVRTYGMSETAGGCVYDGVPLDGVKVRVDTDGRIAIGGPTLASGYRNPPDPDPFAEPGWFRTDDIGAVDDSGVLTVLGRADEAISTGGLTVLPQPVEAALRTHPAVADCAVFGLRRRAAGSAGGRRRGGGRRLRRALARRAADPRHAHPGPHCRAPGTAYRRRAADARHRQGGPAGAGTPRRTTVAVGTLSHHGAGPGLLRMT